MSVSAEAPPAREPDDPRSPAAAPRAGSRPKGPKGPNGPKDPKARPARPLAVTGGIAAFAAAASGLAALTTLTAIGWITAPHVGLGTGLGGVLRTAALLWLVAHHVGVTVHGAGRIGLLPLGLVLLPGALLAVAGRWVVHAGAVTRLRHVGYAALALALPYTLLAGAVAVASRNSQAAPSLWQAVVASFLLALVAGGLGAARGLAPWSRLARLMPARPRSVILGMLGACALLTAAGAALAGASLAAHLPQVKAATDALAPGAAGAALLLLAQLAYAPNAIIWAVAYLLGPGFAFGAGTVVAPTGSALGALPVFPMLAALPAGPRSTGPAWLTVLILATPYLAGVFAGVVTVRVTPTPVIEAAALWGLAAGAATGALAGLAAAFAGGPLGDGRLATVGPSGWQVGLVAMLQIGVTAALTAAAANWLILRRTTPQRPRKQSAEESQQAPEPTPPPRIPVGVIDETDDAGGHRIYLNPWADQDDQDELDDLDDLDELDELDEELPAVLQHADLAADRLVELGVADLLGGHRVRAAHARVVGTQLRPEHRQHQQPQRAEREAEPAEHDPGDRPARPRRAAAPRPPARPGAEPDRRRGEHQGHDGHQHAAMQVAQSQRQAEQAEHAHRDRRHGPLPKGGVRRWQLPGREQPSRLGPAPARRLISGHRVHCALSGRLPGPVP
ncbi:MAG TPA: DUF6350 family protein [Streptosporangiaceae bacterium]|nr:DUF6350 family protein [Streptosporangiaceae bacterium]